MQIAVLYVPLWALIFVGVFGTFVLMASGLWFRVLVFVLELIYMPFEHFLGGSYFEQTPSQKWLRRVLTVFGIAIMIVPLFSVPLIVISLAHADAVSDDVITNS